MQDSSNFRKTRIKLTVFHSDFIDKVLSAKETLNQQEAVLYSFDLSFSLRQASARVLIIHVASPSLGNSFLKQVCKSPSHFLLPAKVPLPYGYAISKPTIGVLLPKQEAVTGMVVVSRLASHLMQQFFP